MAMTDAEFDSYLSGLSTPTVNDPGLWSDVKRGAGQVVQSTGSYARDAAPDLGQWLEQVGQGVVERNPSRINTDEDILANPGTALREGVGEMVGQFGPQVASSLALAKLGAMLGTPLGPAGAATGGLVGGAAGMFLPSYIQNTGGTRMRQREKGMDSAEDIAAAHGTGALSGALDAFTGVQGTALKLMGKAGMGMTEKVARELAEQGLLKTVLKEGGKSALWEGPVTEPVQDFLSKLASDDPLTDRGAISDYIVGAFKGAAGGGVIGGGMSPMTRANASGLVDQIDGARATLAAPLESLDQLPQKQSAADFLSSVTANDFGSARALEFAQAQSEAAVQDRDVLLEGIAQKNEAEAQVQLQTVAQEAQQTAAQERQKQIDELIKAVQSDVETAAKEAQDAGKAQMESEGQQRTERDSGFVRPEMRLPLPTDLLGDPLFSPVTPPAPAVAPGVNEWLSQGLEINERRAQIDTDSVLRQQAIEMLDRAARGFGTQAAPEQLPLLGPRGGIAPGVVPRRVAPLQQVQAAAAQAVKTGAITQEQYADVAAGIAANVPPAEVQTRLGEYLGANRSAPTAAPESSPQGSTDLGGGVDVAGVAGGQLDAGVRSGAPGGLAVGVEPPVPVATPAAQAVTPQERIPDVAPPAQAVESQQAETPQKTAAAPASLLTPKKVAPEWLMDELEGEYNLPGKKKSVPGALSSLVEDIDTKIQNYRDFIACLRG